MAVRKRIQDVADELETWLPKYGDGPKQLPTIIWRLLASMPGGEEAEQLGYQPLVDNMSWPEIILVGNMLSAIEDKKDVEDLIELLAEDAVHEALDDDEEQAEGEE